MSTTTAPAPAGLTLHVNDWDDEGTLYTLTGRGKVLQTYCVLTVRAAILARLTSGERDQLADLPFVAPEHFVSRLVADRGECGDPDIADRGDPGPWCW